MSLSTLPDNLIQTIVNHLPTFHPARGPQNPWLRIKPVREPLILLDSDLLHICATNRALRQTCIPRLYETVVLNLERNSLENQAERLRLSWQSGASLLQHVKHVIVRDMNRTISPPHMASRAWQSIFNPTFNPHLSTLYNLSASHTTHHLEILRTILTSLPALITLTLSDTNVHLTHSLLHETTIHPTLKTLSILSFHQLSSLPPPLCLSTSLSRIHIRGLLLDRNQPPLPSGLLQACLRGPDHGGIRIEEFILQYYDPPLSLDGLTFSGLWCVSLRYAEGDTTLVRSSDAFIARHLNLHVGPNRRGLKSLHIEGNGQPDGLVLANVPCLDSLATKAHERGFEDAVYISRSCTLDQGWRGSMVTDPGHPNSALDLEGEGREEWIVKHLAAEIKNRTNEVLGFMLENLPPCEGLALSRISSSGEDDDGPSFSTTWSTILHHAPSLTHLTSLSLSNFPLFDHPLPPSPSSSSSSPSSLPAIPFSRPQSTSPLSPTSTAYALRSSQIRDRLSHLVDSSRLVDRVEELARRCSSSGTGRRLQSVSMAGPDGWAVGSYVLSFGIWWDGEGEKVNVGSEISMST